jgi:hypothetical protein
LGIEESGWSTKWQYIALRNFSGKRINGTDNIRVDPKF